MTATNLSLVGRVARATLGVLVLGSIALGQETAPPAAPPSAGATPEKAVGDTASPELVGQLASELAITPRQAEGAAGTLFGVAKSRLKPADFAKVAASVPNMDGLLAAAPAMTSGASVDPAGGVGGLGGMAAAAGTLSKLGLKPETISKLTPTLVKAVQSKGGAEVGQLLASALK
jgi:hypothetical protein